MVLKIFLNHAWKCYSIRKAQHEAAILRWNATLTIWMFMMRSTRKKGANFDIRLAKKVKNIFTWHANTHHGTAEESSKELMHKFL